VMYLYNKNKQDALFYFQFISVINLCMFRGGYCSSSGVTCLYIQQLVYVMRLCCLAVGRIGVCVIGSYIISVNTLVNILNIE
jgi:hypothetical protein